MGEPVRVGEGLTDEDSAAAERAKQDRLIAEIEASPSVPDWCLPRAMERLGELRGSPVAWLATRYLQAVLTRGAAMFDQAAGEQQTLADVPDPALLCGCGATARVTGEERLGGRRLAYARCPVCRADLVAVEPGHPG